MLPMFKNAGSGLWLKKPSLTVPSLVLNQCCIQTENGGIQTSWPPKKNVPKNEEKKKIVV